MADLHSASAVPLRAIGVAPDGPLQGSGFADQQWLVRRGPTFVQVSELLYRVVELSDGTRTVHEIARELTASTRWAVGPEEVIRIIEAKLVPLRLLQPPGGEDLGPATPRATSPLLVAARLRVLGPRAIERAARVLQHFYRPPVIIAGVVAIAVSQIWLFAQGDPSAALQRLASTPLALPLVGALLIGAGVVHEFGHAAALRYGGGRARGMGAGLYLFIPILYTDVTESYRLSRRARVRTDLGGLYFHLLAAAGFIAAASVNSDPYLVAAAFVITLDVAWQLIPFIRMDGYWLLADLTGIPDLFTHALPRLRRRFTKGGRGLPPSPPLHPGVKRIFAWYVAFALPAIVGLFGYAVWHAPTVFRTAAGTLSQRAELIGDAVTRGDAGPALLALVEMLLLALPTVGLVFFFFVVARFAVRLALRGRPRTELAPVPAPAAGTVPLTSEPVSLTESIADHLELKRRHAAEPGPILESHRVASIS